MSEFRIVRMAAEHLSAMEAIEKVSFPVSWGEGSFARELNENRLSRYFVALLDGEVAGYIGSWQVMDELHISTFAVDPAKRDHGIGRRLLIRLLQNAVEEGVRWSVLEVRESNLAAINVYEKFGFRKVGTRKKYYENDENALVLWVGQMQQQEFRARLADAALVWAADADFMGDVPAVENAADAVDEGVVDSRPDR